MKHLKAITVIICALVTQGAQSLEVINPNNPKYVSSIEHLSRYMQLLTKAENELMSIYNLDSLPGYNPSNEIGRIQDMKGRANFILNPEKRRLMLKPLILDESYGVRPLNSIPLKKE